MVVYGFPWSSSSRRLHATAVRDCTKHSPSAIQRIGVLSADSCSWHLQLALHLAMLGSVSVWFGHLLVALPAYPYLATDYATVKPSAIHSGSPMHGSNSPTVGSFDDSQQGKRLRPSETDPCFFEFKAAVLVVSIVWGFFSRLEISRDGGRLPLFRYRLLRTQPWRPSFGLLV